MFQYLFDLFNYFRISLIKYFMYFNDESDIFLDEYNGSSSND